MTSDAPDTTPATEEGPRRTPAQGATARARPAPAPRVTRPVGEVRRALAPIEFTFDLRQTPPDKVLGRLFAALDRVTPDVTLLVILRDVPELAGVTANAVALLARAGYVSDLSRLPGGGQRMRVRSRSRPRDPYLAEASETLEAAGAPDAGPPANDPFPEG